jgi:hypothetical protein
MAWAMQVVMVLLSVLAWSSIAIAQQATPAEPPAAAVSGSGAPESGAAQAAAPEQARSTGLPGALKWTFNLDAGWGTFGFANSFYNNPHDPGVPENLSDQWFEGYVKPSLSGVYTFESTSEIYGKVSAVGERTYGSIPPAFGEDVSSFGPEDLSIGWRSGKSIELGENAVDVVIGRTQYRIGHGFLVWDGASEGGSRGGYWTNGRKAFQFATVGRFQAHGHKGEIFYLDRDELPESDSGSRTFGFNYEYTPKKDNTIGVTYMKWFAHKDLKPQRDGLNVFNIRAYSAPIAPVPQVSFEFEYASERNGDALDSNAWTLQGAYEFSGVAWKPKVSYRYAFFQGDDPASAKNESFDPLFLGFYDWGTWWQGEIAGEYFISNSNLKSSLLRLHVTPTDRISGGLLFFNFHFDNPAAAAPQVTNSHIAFETDLYTDWKLNSNFTVSFILAFADSGKGIQQLSGRTKNFGYGMVYLGYSF